MTFSRFATHVLLLGRFFDVAVQHSLRVKHTDRIAVVDPLDRQRSD